MDVIENAIPADMLLAAWADWPAEDWPGWHFYNSRDSIKYATRDAEMIPWSVRECIRELVRVSADFVKPGCWPDWGLTGSGMHMIPPGGHLSPHLDSSVMHRTKWHREYSCVLCVNPEWHHDWGGTFIMQEPPQSPGAAVIRKPVAAQFNRAIIFETTDDSVHEVTRVSGEHPRCTISIFYWSNRQDGRRRMNAEFV